MRRRKASSRPGKHEEVYLSDYQTFAEFEAQLGQFIEAVYHVKRRHSSLGYRPPARLGPPTAYHYLEVTLPLVQLTGVQSSGGPLDRWLMDDPGPRPRGRRSWTARSCAPHAA